MIDTSKEFELYFVGLLADAIKDNDMVVRDWLVRNKENIKWEWTMKRRITTSRYDNEYK